MRGLAPQRQQGQGAGCTRTAGSTKLRRVLQARPAAPPSGGRPAAATTPAAAAATPDAATTPDAEPLLVDVEEEERRYERFRQAFRAANTMSQLYNIDRPPPVPLEEFEQRRRDRETGEVADAAKRLFGAPEDATREALAQLETLVPGLLDLSSMTAREFALLASDVSGAVARIVALRVAWPRADVGRVLRRRPRMLLPPGAAATLKRLARGRPGAAAPPRQQQAGGDADDDDDDAQQMAAATRVAREAASVRLALSGGGDPAARAAVAAAAERAGHSSVEAAVDAVIEAAPELMDPLELSRALAFVRASFPSSAGRHPAALVAENPALLLNLGESNVEDSAEYGEITTRF
jgi:hypothetical protein